MTTIDAFLLGAIQGLTEFLPVSSSGHLVILSSIFKAKNSLTFDIAVHFASLIAILVFFRRDIANVIKEVYQVRFFETLLFKILLASVPAALVAFAFENQIEKVFQQEELAASMLYATTFLLVTAELTSRFKKQRKEKFTLFDSLIVGAFQALAIIPGISRSGSTISAGMITGHSREASARFSFLLVIPAILGALLLDTLRTGFSNLLQLPILVGFFSSLLFSLLALKILYAVIKKYSFYPFAIYCFLVATTYLFFR
ncbi:MAG: undecaprenyl-diphosphate phosphatase [Actinobacteria bacterium]|nr:undecaprenyl-diphosphate phosphatase [Actinomycetota bacterium]